jgi:signal transduction histidine kinase
VHAVYQPEPQHAARILVVEDEMAVALDLCARLRGLGYDVVGHAASAAQAFSLASRRPPELVLMDIRIGGPSDSAETARRLFEQFDAGVIYLTTGSDEHTLARASSAQPYAFLPKPVREDDLRRAVETALRTRRHFHGLCQTFEHRRAAEDGVPIENAAFDRSLAARAAELAQANERLGALTLQLQQAVHSKDAFLTGMSHELRTPLASILGFTDLLLMGIDGPLTPAQRKHVDIIQRNSEHLLSLINDLLDLAKASAGPLELQPMTVNCSHILEEIVASVMPLAEVKRLALEAEPPDPRLVVRADSRALRQILLNLVSNAIKFTEQGEVRVTCRSGTEEGRACVLWEVRDTGPGLSAEDMTRLFHPFTRLHEGARVAQGGAGLGLHLSRTLAQQMQGAIRVESVAKVGSVFTLVLPASAPDDGDL